MRLLACAATAALLLLVATPAVSAYSDTYAPLEPATDPLYAELRPICAELLEDMRANGTVGDHSSHQGYDYGVDYWADAPECAALRDEVQWQYNAYGAIPFTMACYDYKGVNCVAVNHYACDFALIIGSGLVYHCLQGFNPEN